MSYTSHRFQYIDSKSLGYDIIDNGGGRTRIIAHCDYRADASLIVGALNTVNANQGLKELSLKLMPETAYVVAVPPDEEKLANE